MEPFYLYDLGIQTENKAIQRILCPMAAELCHLILALEQEDGMCQTLPNIEENAERLAKATDELASAARRLAEQSSDKVYQEETQLTAQSLMMAGRHVLQAAQQLQGQPDSHSHREVLAAAAKGVLTETVKILRIEGAAGTRRITQAASWLLECLGTLRDTGDVPGLLGAFQDFSKAFLLLSNLTAQHLQELQDSPRRTRLAQTLQLLQECVPLIHESKHRHLQCSWPQRVNCSKNYAFQLMERTIQELVSLLVNSKGSNELQDRHGTFSHHVQRLLALLYHPDPVHLSDSEFSAHVEAVVFYCMLLAEMCRADLKQDLVKRCWVLLQLRKSICCHVSQQEGRTRPSWGESSLQEECHTMRKEVKDLDQAVLKATLHEILNAFSEAKEPLRQLVEEALTHANTGYFPAEQGGLLKKLQPLTATFFTHAQQVLRVTDFVLGRCTKPQTATEIHDCIEHLKSLLASLPPVLTEMSRNPTHASTAQQLQSLYHAWARTTENLLQCFEDTISMHEFMKVSIQEMAKHKEWCDKALQHQDPERLSRHAAVLTSWARWVTEAAVRYVDRATDPIFRNGLLVWVEQLAKSILELKAAMALCAEKCSCLQTRAVFSKTVSSLMDAAHCIQDGLDGSNHPDILSPLREQVRGADVTKELELNSSYAGLKNITSQTKLQEDTLSNPSPQAGNSHPDVVPRKGEIHPVITALLAATRAHDTAAVNAACSALLEVSTCCIDAAKEALPIASSPLMEMLGQYQKIILLTPCVISLARETAPGQLQHQDRLLQTALSLSETIRETKECLAALAGSWYSLSQQVLGFILAADFMSSKQALDETMMGLAGAVQIAEDIASMACSKQNPICPGVWENFLQVQAKFSHAQMNTKVLLEKAMSFEGSCKLGEARLELHCVHWAISMHVLLGAVDQFIGRDILFLRELRSAMENKLCPQSLLAAVSEASLRLQEAARLSYFTCPEDRGHSEILTLREEIKVLVEALLDAFNTLLVSPLPTASLYIRFELLQRDLALRAKALLLHLEKANTEHLQVIRDVVGPALSSLPKECREMSLKAFKEKASQLMANIQWVKTTLQNVLETTAQLQSWGDLLSVADHLLVLTSDAVDSASQLFQSHQDKRHLHLDSIVWYWSAKAHYLAMQLQAVQGINGHILELMRQHLQNMGDQCSPKEHSSTAKISPAQQLDALRPTKSAETCLSRSGQASRAIREAREMQGNSPLSTSFTSSFGKQEREDSDRMQGGPSRMTQITKDVAVRMLHMTQFLRKKGPITSKEQLVACAMQIASDGQAFVTFGRIIAKICLDKSCSAELLCAAEQTHTISSQLAIVARACDSLLLTLKKQQLLLFAPSGGKTCCGIEPSDA
ncbi:vinculin-like isoform X2 [Coturnix japonica]|uniref:vinculin-like isoform X2 n=1 Tax=Coturnix japonica TaxID=93934 RepID=UPI000777C763|nr:vinculin-like isoform X2 [Coturnix japonica]